MFEKHSPECVHELCASVSSALELRSCLVQHHNSTDVAILQDQAMLYLHMQQYTSCLHLFHCMLHQHQTICQVETRLQAGTYRVNQLYSCNPTRTHMNHMSMTFNSGKSLCTKLGCVTHSVCCLQYMSKVEEIISRASTLAQPGEECRGMFAVVPGNSHQVQGSPNKVEIVDRIKHTIHSAM